MRQTMLVAMALALALTTSGCVGAVTGDAITFEASPTVVGDEALDEHGFEQTNESTFTVRREADVPYVGTREVVITNHVTSYARAGGDGQGGGSAAGLLVVSTPQAQVLGQGVNPLGRVPVEELVDRVGGRAGDQRDVRKVGESSLTVLGSEATIHKFATTTRTQQGSVETYVYVARIGHEGDYVIAVGVLPRQFEDQESALYGMMGAIEHPASGD